MKQLHSPVDSDIFECRTNRKSGWPKGKLIQVYLYTSFLEQLPFNFTLSSTIPLCLNCHIWQIQLTVVVAIVRMLKDMEFANIVQCCHCDHCNRQEALINQGLQHCKVGFQAHQLWGMRTLLNLSLSGAFIQRQDQLKTCSIEPLAIWFLR